MVRKKSLTSTRNDLSTLFEVGAIGRLTDAELLKRFSDGRGDYASDAAFATIVERHGPMVLGVCRRVLGDEHTAADAFQATFLILARKARTVRVEDSLGPWLYGVSVRVARRAKSVVSAERARVQNLDGIDPPDETASSDLGLRDELRTVIDEELVSLPVRYRSAVVLCYLEGLTQEQAARRLRCPVGTVQSRLHRARERLRSRLTRRGLAPTVGGLAGVLERTSRSAVPSDLAKGTAAAAARIMAGEALAGAAPVAVAGLAGFQLRTMMMRQCWMLAGLIALGITTTVGAVGLATAGDEPKATPRADDPKPTAKIVAERPEPPLAEKLDRLKAEYEDAFRAYDALYRGSTIPEENRRRPPRSGPTCRPSSAGSSTWRRPHRKTRPSGTPCSG